MKEFRAHVSGTSVKRTMRIWGKSERGNTTRSPIGLEDKNPAETSSLTPSYLKVDGNYMLLSTYKEGLSPSQRESFDRVATHTYPFIRNAAIQLHVDLQEEISQVDEPIDFGNSALDVGSRDGRYMQILREMGPTEITAIDPSTELQKGVNAGYIEPNEAFFGSLKKYRKKNGRHKVDAVFAFNVEPTLPSSPSFITSLMDSVKPGGLVVCTFAEYRTCASFLGKTLFVDKLTNIKQKPFKDKAIYSEERNPRTFEGPNKFIYIGRRTNIS